MKKVIVAGGAGFLGSHLCEYLLRFGYKVTCVDNLLTGSLENIKHLKGKKGFQFVKYDIVSTLPKGLIADQVYHLASPASPNYRSVKSYHSLPFETMLANTRGTWEISEFCVKHKARFLFASTSEIYGDPKEHPQKETYKGNVSTIGPRSVYDEAKRFGETITQTFIRERGLNGRIVRIFNTYGPGMALDDGRVVINFVQSALSDDPITLYGNGLQTRSFCFVSDLIRGLALAMNHAGTKGEVFNLGNPKEYTILDLAKKVKEITGSRSEIVFADKLPQDDPLQRCPDIAKAKLVLGWEPKVGLDEGLRELIRHLNGRLLDD